MQAVILAAGLGKRLRPLTNWMPKPMLLVRGRPILAHTLEALPPEIDEVILVVNYLGEQIRAYFGDTWTSPSDPKRSISIKYVRHEELNGTAGALCAAQNALQASKRFLVLMGDDLYGRADISNLMMHERAVLARERQDPLRFGTFVTTPSGDLISIADAGTKDRRPPHLVNCGAYVLDEKYFSVPVARAPSGEIGLPHTLAQLPSKGFPVKVVRARGWRGIGMLEELQAANNAIVDNEKFGAVNVILT